MTRIFVMLWVDFLMEIRVTRLLTKIPTGKKDTLLVSLELNGVFQKMAKASL